MRQRGTAVRRELAFDRQDRSCSVCMQFANPSASMTDFPDGLEKLP
jgi:hypothetical protein